MLFCKHSDQRSDSLGLAKVASADHTSRICFSGFYGCISRLHMHLWADISTNQDHFPLTNASLPGFFSKSGSLFPCKCIPEQTFPAYQDHFSQANASLNRLSCKSGSLFPRKMHPCQAFPANQDHFPLANTSLPEFSCISGSFLT